MTDEKRGPGRPRGKHSDPNYEQTTLFMNWQVKKRARAALKGTNEDLSSLINRLLIDWLNQQNKE